MIKPGLWVAMVVAAVIIQVPASAAQEIINVPTGDRVLEPSVTELFRVGSMAGEEWETFADVRGVAFDGAGNLYVLDAENHRVVVTDGSGRLLRQFGKEGDGPGELRFASGMVVAPDGTVAVLDLGHQAFVIYDADGNFVRNARNEYQTGLVGGSAQYHPRHGAVGVRSSLSMGPGEGSGSGALVRFVPFDKGAEIEDLSTAWRAPPVVGEGGTFAGNGGSFRMSGMTKLRAFDPILRTAVLPDGRIALADSTGYAIKLVDPEGGVGTIVRRGIQPRAVTKRDQAAEIDRRRKEIEDRESSGGGSTMLMMVVGGGGGGAQTMSIGRDQMKEMELGRLESIIFAAEFPVISNMAADKEGRIWVERTGARVGEDGPTDVITTDGEYLGTIPADGMRIPEVFGPNGLVAYVETDEFDVEYVVVKQFRGIGRD